MFLKNKILSQKNIFLAALNLMFFSAFPILVQAAADSYGLPTAPLKTIIDRVIIWFLGFSAGLAVLFIIIGGIYYVTAIGDDSKIETGKKMITYAVLGLAVVGVSYAIVKAIGEVIK